MSHYQHIHIGIRFHVQDHVGNIELNDALREVEEDVADIIENILCRRFGTDALRIERLDAVAVNDRQCPQLNGDINATCTYTEGHDGLCSWMGNGTRYEDPISPAF